MGLRSEDAEMRYGRFRVATFVLVAASLAAPASQGRAEDAKVSGKWSLEASAWAGELGILGFGLGVRRALSERTWLRVEFQGRDTKDEANSTRDVGPGFPFSREEAFDSGRFWSYAGAVGVDWYLAGRRTVSPVLGFGVFVGGSGNRDTRSSTIDPGTLSSSTRIFEVQDSATFYGATGRFGAEWLATSSFAVFGSLDARLSRSDYERRFFGEERLDATGTITDEFDRRTEGVRWTFDTGGARLGAVFYF